MINSFINRGVVKKRAKPDDPIAVVVCADHSGGRETLKTASIIMTWTYWKMIDINAVMRHFKFKMVDK
jgi:hypothetical protein